MKRLLSLLVLVQVGAIASFVESPKGPNVALVVGSGYDLPVDKDVVLFKALSHFKPFAFKTTTLLTKEATEDRLMRELTLASQLAGDTGTLLFYYTGHGTEHTIFLNEEALGIEKVATAIRKGRQGKKPLAKLVLLFDACHSGSFLGDFRRHAALFSQSIVNTFAVPPRTPYWKKLVVLASTEPDEVCYAYSDGSHFTNTLKEVFEEEVDEDTTLGDFFEAVKSKKVYATPTSRFFPAEVRDEFILFEESF